MVERMNNTSKGLKPEGYPLGLVQAGERVKIVSLRGGRGFFDKLSGMGLRLDATIDILNNPMDGKVIVNYEGTKLFLGGGMASKILVSNINEGVKE